jgi:hypothetical protein
MVDGELTAEEESTANAIARYVVQRAERGDVISGEVSPQVSAAYDIADMLGLWEVVVEKMELALALKKAEGQEEN